MTWIPFCSFPSVRWAPRETLKEGRPWRKMVWLSWLGIVLSTERLPVSFPVRAQARKQLINATLTHWSFSLFLLLSLPPYLNINLKNIFEEEEEERSPEDEGTNAKIHSRHSATLLPGQMWARTCDDREDGKQWTFTSAYQGAEPSS